ncbi:tetracycline resistance protein [Nitzschia inconspicua]|uniref:Tetracycline resistance protein n=1 Tax=Nitzschia inconspicua TaxID=303405 RepID=A0A9K3LNS3_9STRA|nr:tetracycline resistance protein [Nitzschia inconspicua]
MASHESTSIYNSNINDQEDHHLLIPTTTTSPASSSQGVEFVKSPTATTTDETMESVADETHPRSQTSRNIFNWFNTTTTTSSTTSTTIPSSIQQIDINERPPRPSVYRRQSFIEEFVQTRGPPQIAGLMILIAIGLGCTIGVVPAVMTDRFARLNHGWEESPAAACSTFQQSHNVPSACIQGSADAQTAVATSNLISNVLTFLTSSLLGSWSDRHGRKILLIAGMAIGAIPPFLLWLMQLLPTMSPWWYYSFHASTGMINWVAVAFSALADVLPPSMRAPGIGLLMAGFMLGFSLAPILALLLTSIQLSFVSFATVLTGLVCTIQYVPETLSPELASEARRKRRQQEEENEAAVLQTSNESTAYRVVCSIFHNVLLRPFQEMSILNRNTFFRLISSLAFFSGMVSSGDQILLVYYLEERLGFTNQDVSVMFLVVGIMGLVAQGLLLKPLNDLLGEKNVVTLAFLCGALDNAMYGLAKNKTTIFVALGVAGLTGIAFPTISAIKANNVDPSEQGRIQGALYSLQALASGLGPVALKFVYSQTKHTKVGPGSMFLFASGLYLVAVCIACSLPNDKANAARCRDGTATAVPSSQRQHMNNDDDDEEYMQLASDSSFSDEDDYGTMESTTDAATASTRIEKRTNKGRQGSAV